MWAENSDRPAPAVLHRFPSRDRLEDGGLDVVDVFAPYAVHGLDRALGLRPSRLPWVCFVLGLFGAVAMLLFQYWASAVSWPINVGGKPWNSWPAFVPVTFEMMVLCAGVGTVAAFVWVAGLRPGRRSALSDLRVTDDRFALVLRESGSTFDRAGIEAVHQGQQQGDGQAAKGEHAEQRGQPDQQPPPGQ